MQEPITITIEKNIHVKLRNEGRMGETWSELLGRLLEERK